MPFQSSWLRASEDLRRSCAHSWEMSTIGHPLSDLANLLGPYTLAQPQPRASISFKGPSHPLIESRANPAFLPNAGIPGLPSRNECIAMYAEAAGWDPRPEDKGDMDESLWGDAFGVFRNSVIMQGIAARYALRQASSAQAQEIGALMGPFGEAAWALVGKCKDGAKMRDKSRL